MTVDLVTASKKGNMDAFEELVRLYQNRCFAYALAQVGDDTLAQDVVQETFLIAFRNLHKLADVAAFPGWLKTIAYRRALRCRQQKRSTSFLDKPTAETSSKTVQRLQEKELLLKAVNDLPHPMREIVVMYYLEDASQQDVADFLGLSKTFVNNQLHAGRQQLKTRLLNMAKDTFENKKLDDKFAKSIAELVAIDGAIVEARSDNLAILDAMGGDNDAKMFVVQRREDGAFICMASETPSGALSHETDTSTAMRQFSEDAVKNAIGALSGDRDNVILETGIRALDVFAPIPRDGSVGLFGGAGVGRAVLAMELIHRQASFQGSVNAFFFVNYADLMGTKEFVASETLFSKDVFANLKTAWIAHPRGGDPNYASEADYLDSRLYFSPALAIQGVWPALDPLRSHSALLKEEIVGARHIDIVSRTKSVLREANEIVETAGFYQAVAFGSRAEAREIRSASFEKHQDKTVVHRARLIENYLTQPFYVAEEFSGRKGEVSDVDSSLDVLEGILNGEYDDAPNSKFSWGGFEN